jgi:hypothetical protein
VDVSRADVVLSALADPFHVKVTQESEGWIGSTGTAVPFAATSDMRSPITLQWNLIATTALAPPGACFPQPALLGLVAAGRQQPGAADDFVVRTVCAAGRPHC